MAGYAAIDFEDAQAFAYRFIRQKPLPEFLRTLRSLVGPVILSSSDSRGHDWAENATFPLISCSTASHSMVPFFNAHRMVQQYVLNAYS